MHLYVFAGQIKKWTQKIQPSVFGFFAFGSPESPPETAPLVADDPKVIFGSLGSFNPRKFRQNSAAAPSIIPIFKFYSSMIVYPLLYFYPHRIRFSAPDWLICQEVARESI